MDPEYWADYDAQPETDYRNLKELRALDSDMFSDTMERDDVRERETTIPGPDGHKELVVKIYEPANRRDALPGLLWIHGGGYITGSALQHDPQCQMLCAQAGCVVVSPEYRLAPEHPYPAALEDCYAALQWLYRQGSELGADRARLAIGGASAGGGLCAALAHINRDRGGPALCLQMPLYPMLDCRQITHSSREFTDCTIWNVDSNAFGWEAYLGGLPQPTPPAASPSLAADFSRLPPAFTFIGDLDLFLDETLDYVQKLSAAGVPVELHVYPGCCHGFDLFTPDAKKSRHANERTAEALKAAFARSE